MSKKMSTGIDLNGQKAVNAADPQSGTDLATKQYIDNLIAGLSWKDEVRVATTANGTLATAYANGQTIDGQVLATGDRILIKDQTTQTENGIYTAPVGTWYHLAVTRGPAGTFLYVNAAQTATNADTGVRRVDYISELSSSWNVGAGNITLKDLRVLKVQASAADLSYWAATTV